jgi:hypothetical protein
MKKRTIQWPLISGIAVALMIAVLILTGGGHIPRALTGAEENTEPAEALTYTVQELQEDFKRLRSVVKKRHPMLYAEREEITEIFDTQYARLEAGMGELDFHRILAPAVAALNCGHSNVLPSRDYEAYLKEEALLLPLEVRVSERRLYVTASEQPDLIPSGAELLSINGYSAEEILDILFDSVSSDGWNTTRIEAVIDNQFSYLYHILIDDAETFTVIFRTGGANGSADNGANEAETCQLTGTGFTELWGNNHEIVSIGVLLDMAALRSDYSGQVFDSHALLSVGSFILDQKEFATFLDDFFRKIERRNIDTLVLDLRGNWGGTPRPAALLLSYLTEAPVRYFNSEAPFYYMFSYKREREPQEHAFSGEVYLLMDGACFSTTPHFISLMKHHGLATLVGEEAGGSSVCTDGKRRLVLPNTGLRVYYSTRVFETATSGFTPGIGIQPDYEVILSPEVFATAVDPVLDFTASLAAGKEL